MQQHTKHVLALTLGGIALVAVAATAGAVINNQIKKSDDVPVKQVVATNTVTHHKENIHWNNPPARQQPVQQVSTTCDDGNVVGYGLGALAGGVVGHQLGGGKGKDVATIGGAAAGALAGGQYLPTRGVLCRH